jgi:perosamine synthetase
MYHEATFEFEKAFAARLGANRGFSFWKARVALYAILKAMGVGSGDEMILPGYTCVINVNPIKYLGARPVNYEQLFILTYMFFSLTDKHS